MALKKPVLGIDFGTTNTSAAWVDARGSIQMVPVNEVDTALPSVIWWAAKDRFLVGAGARERLLDDPTNTVFGFKRFLGRKAPSASFLPRAREKALWV